MAATQPAEDPPRASDRGGVGLYGAEAGATIIRAAVAELVGTFILVFTGMSVAVATLLDRPTAGSPYDSLAIALAFGLALTAVVASIGHVSGAHVNPAVTLALAATKKLPWRAVPAFVVAQLVGAVLAALMTLAVFGGEARGKSGGFLASTAPTSGVAVGQALIVEVAVAFILVFVVMSVATDPRVDEGVAPIAVGFALACGVFIAGPISGGAVNPARALGPMLVSGHFDSFWIYIVGPVAGAVAAAFLYDRFLAQARPPGEEPET